MVYIDNLQADISPLVMVVYLTDDCALHHFHFYQKQPLLHAQIGIFLLPQFCNSSLKIIIIRIVFIIIYNTFNKTRFIM